MAAEFMEGFYAPANARNALMRRNKQRFSPLAARFSEFSSNNPGASMSPSADKLRLFQMFWGIDKIPRRDANRATNVCLVSLTLEILGYPYMKKLAIAASIAALALMTACAKKDAEATA